MKNGKVAWVKAPGRAEGYSGGLLFRFGRRINSQINVTTATEGVGFAGQTFCIQRDGMLMAGIQFTAGEHEFQLFHQQRKGGRWYASASLNRPLIPARSAKVMQAVTLLHQTCPKQGVTVQGSPTEGGRDCRQEALSRRQCV